MAADQLPGSGFVERWAVELVEVGET